MNAVIETNLITVLPQRGRGQPPITDGRRFNDISLAEQIERWERVRLVLRKMTPHQITKHFRMDTWIQKDACGTIGCAAGQCSLDPWFNRRGFSVKWKVTEYDFGNTISWDWTMMPRDFFGCDGYHSVFANEASMHYWRNGISTDLTPKQQHRAALRNVNQYLKSLKAELL